MNSTLSAENLTLIRGERCLFEGLGFAVKSGELLILEGRNGCGKTSLMRAIAGMLSLETGEVFWNQTPVRQQRQEFHGSLVWLAHRTGLKGDLNMLENLHFERSLRQQSAGDAESVYVRLGIERLRKLPLRSLSAGQQRRVALARLLLNDAVLWILDEPFTALDMAAVDLLQQVIRAHLDKGGMVVLTTHQEVPLTSGQVKRLKLGWRE